MTLPPLPEPAQTSSVIDSTMRRLEVHSYTAAQMQAYAQAAVLAEREECAKLCEAEFSIEGIAQRCAAAIRARGE